MSSIVPPASAPYLFVPYCTVYDGGPAFVPFRIFQSLLKRKKYNDHFTDALHIFPAPGLLLMIST